MTIIKRKKFTRQRGSRSYGWGREKRHRGAGSRGGRGMAGTGKRADQKKPTILKLYGSSYFGKHGFKIPPKIKKTIKPINLKYIEENLDNLIKKNLIKKQDDTIIVNLKDLGFNKLLATGKVTKKFKITAPFFSKNAIEKIKKAGGEAIKESKNKNVNFQNFFNESTRGKTTITKTTPV